MSREQTGADHGTDVLKVCVCDQKQGAYSEFRPDPNQGLDAFYNPYSYVTRCEVHYEDERLAA